MKSPEMGAGSRGTTRKKSTHTFLAAQEIERS